MAFLMTNPKFSAWTAAGIPGAGYKLYTYTAGTTTPLATYTDSTGGTANANPVVLNARGEADVYLATSSFYKFILKTDADVTVWTVDNVGAGELSTAFAVEHNTTTGVHVFAGTSAAGDTFYQGVSSVARLALGTAGYVLTAGASAPAWAERPLIKDLYVTRDISLTSDLVVTGVGFTSRLIICVINQPGSSIYSIGWSTGGAGTCIHDFSRAAGATNWRGDSGIAMAFPAEGTSNLATVTAIGSDGFTLSWTKTGSPTGNIGMQFLCMA